ncbi:unnamed protein product [Effrenium voratum]|uniref:Protein kinase domain-containing protein n=1 Tax=Effrenium voratum TaxID=2562239 RepID=A0AA36MQN7_9DINO|nr:unnamed protein product [Effrenium voratum]CAJ1376650.1 unnamed protein product [Effrenium voratum]CAJ1442081.1 unnamed protein product [Effrenium voratum]
MGVAACHGSHCRGAEAQGEHACDDEFGPVLQFEVEHIGAPASSSQLSHGTKEQRPRQVKSAQRWSPHSAARNHCSGSESGADDHMSRATSEATTLPSVSVSEFTSDGPIHRSHTAPELSGYCVSSNMAAPRNTLWCASCQAEGTELFLSPWDQWKYCKWCWIASEFNQMAIPPSKWSQWPLISVEVTQISDEEDLAAAWRGRSLPSQLDDATESVRTAGEKGEQPQSVVSSIPIQMQSNVVGPLRETSQHNRARSGQLIQGRYQILERLGHGSFAEAYLSTDIQTLKKVCLKRHRLFDVELLADLAVVNQRLQQVDPSSLFFPRLLEAFFDGLGWTVESLVDGVDLLRKTELDPQFFTQVPQIRSVARGALRGLTLLEEAGIVHNDLKPDNIIWVEGPSTVQTVRIVDFNCARLDQRELPGQNWNMLEGGVGCRAYFSPEMGLGLPVTHSSDVWSLAVVLSELFFGRASSLLLCHDRDAVQVSVAQALGLCGMADGIPSSFLRKCPLEIARNFTPALSVVRGHLPVRHAGLGCTICWATVGKANCQKKGTSEDCWRPLLYSMDPLDPPQRSCYTAKAL